MYIPEEGELRVLVTGASGFLGRHLVAELRRRGHETVAAGRGSKNGMRVDFSRDFDVDAWVGRLGGIDAVVNAVGIVRERGTQTFAALHTRAPQSLFGACVIAGVKRVIQISALGADEGTTAYFQS